MDCDCDGLLTKMNNDQAQLTVWQAAKTVAEQNITTWQMNLWYDQYNYMLCGCGGGSSMVAAATDTLYATTVKAVQERDGDKDQMALLATFPSLLRLHQLVMVQIQPVAK